MTIIIVAFVAAMVLAQRQRARLRQEQALLVARAHEEERAWVASELHDDVLQRVALVRAEVESIWTSPEPHSAGRLEDHLRAINAELVDLAVAVRRIASRLHPTIVDQVGLPSALQSLVAEIERGSDLAVEVTTDGPTDRMSQETARAVYRIVQEALRNAARHAAARRARVRLAFGVRDLDLSISDDGRGFDPLATPSPGIGLASMRERALIAGGSATVRSRPGAGTTIDVRLPMGRA
ncbi:MAG: hypothetical protein IPJ78_15580 [Gemmatimonadetes bacterium]|nr:hypothetical protein [Gemmatimonadota bacterium]